MIEQVEEADIRSQHKESWRLVNKISGRKSTKRGILKGKTREERIKKWYEHFQELLGQEPDIEEDEDDVDSDPVLQGLDINDDDFQPDQLARAKTQIAEGKDYGPVVGSGTYVIHRSPLSVKKQQGENQRWKNI